MMAGGACVVGRARFELAVSWSQTRRFTELSYRPPFDLASLVWFPSFASTTKIMSARKGRALRAGGAGARFSLGWALVPPVSQNPMEP
jgi:hypothetical protein